MSRFCRRQKLPIPTAKLFGKTTSPSSIYCWKKNYGDMNVAKVKRLKSLKVENVKLEKLLSEQVLVNEALKELVKKRCWSGNTVSGPMPKVYRFGLCRDCNCPKSGQNKTARQLIP